MFLFTIGVAMAPYGLTLPCFMLTQQDAFIEALSWSPKSLHLFDSNTIPDFSLSDFPICSSVFLFHKVWTKKKTKCRFRGGSVKVCLGGGGARHRGYMGTHLLGPFLRPQDSPGDQKYWAWGVRGLGASPDPCFSPVPIFSL